MRRRFSFPRTAAFGVCLVLSSLQGEAGGPLRYPESRRVEQTDTYHGVSVADPYRWLEGDVRQSPEVRQWVEAQNRVTFEYLVAIPERKAIAGRLAELWDFEMRGVPLVEGGRYFFFRNGGRHKLEMLYTQRTLVEEPEVLVDPNGWSEDGTATLGSVNPSGDGRFVVYGTNEAGSDWEVLRVVEVATRKTFPEELKWVKYCCASWTADAKGFFYTRLPEPAQGTEHQGFSRNQAVYFHRVGTPQSEDVLFHSHPEQPDWITFPDTSEDGRYLLLSINKDGKVFKVLVKDLADPEGTLRVLIPEFDNKYFLFVGNDGSRFYFRTDFEAPRGKVIAVDLEKPDRENWKVVIPESENALRGVTLAGHLLAARYLKDALAHVRIFTLDGKPVRDLALPGIGNAGGFTGSSGGTEMFYHFASFNEPASVYRYDLVTGTNTLIHRPKLAFDPESFEVRQVFYTSKDGTRVPLFLGHKKGLKLDGENPTLLTGYGGFNIAMSPGFRAAQLAWMEQGGVLALPCLRGGGEYGEEWHAAGARLKKQNVFDDFFAAAEWLIANRYTRPAKLAIRGGSNGGLLVGAALTQRPDLFGAAIPAVGVLDMLRYRVFTVGGFWADELGTVDDPEQFKALFAYSPYHNVKNGTKYPAVLVTTGDTDDRVVPAHSFKFAARLQHAQAGEAPILLRVETRAGHRGTSTRSGQIEEDADELAFLVKSLGMRWTGSYGFGSVGAGFVGSGFAGSGFVGFGEGLSGIFRPR